MNIQHLYNVILDREYTLSGWVRTVRTSSSTLGFCNINDGSNPEGLQIVLSDKNLTTDQIDHFYRQAKIGTYITCKGLITSSPAKGQEFEMKLTNVIISIWLIYIG